MAPVAGVDPGPEWTAERARRWHALRVWCNPEDGAAPRLVGLLDIAKWAIVELLRVLERRWDSRRRSASTATDFRRLARLFAEAPGDQEAHLLFHAAFGLWPARHAHLSPLDGEGRSPTRSWAETPAVEVAPALRTTGTLVNKGRAGPVADPGRVRAARQAAQVRALVSHDAIRSGLATDGAVRLSTFARLPTDVFAELLALLGVALDAPGEAGGLRRALSADGQVEVVLSDPGDGRRAILVTDAGTLRGPDLVVSIVLCGSMARAPAAVAHG